MKAQNVLIGVVQTDQRPINEKGCETSFPNIDDDFEYEKNYGVLAQFGIHYDLLLLMNCESHRQF